MGCEGEKYLDLLSGYGVFGLGRNHPEVRRILKDFLDAEYPSLVKMEAPLLSGLLAAELKSGCPMTWIWCFSPTRARKAWKRPSNMPNALPANRHYLLQKVLSWIEHRRLSINGDESFREGFAPFLPDCRAVPFNDLAALENELKNGDVAGFIVEPIQGKGVNLPEPGYLLEAQALCHKHGALFIDDEVQTGMGRTGKFLAIEHDGAWPRTLLSWPNPSPPVSCLLARYCARSGFTKRFFVRCNARWSTVLPLARAVLLWLRAWPRWMCSTATT